MYADKPYFTVGGTQMGCNTWETDNKQLEVSP